jgi:hypothetical protein
VSFKDTAKDILNIPKAYFRDVFSKNKSVHRCGCVALPSLNEKKRAEGRKPPFEQGKICVDYKYFLYGYN